MNRTLAATALTALLISGVASIASAEETKPIDLSLRVGGFFPSDGSARDAGSTWLAIGAEFKLKDLHFGENNPGYSSALTLSVDYYNKSDYYHTPILVNYVGRMNQFYYTAGAGLGYTKVPVLLATKTSSTFAYSFGAGYDFQHGKSPLFIEGRYFGSTESRLNGFAVYLGVRL